jgi:hypothetical protein
MLKSVILFEVVIEIFFHFHKIHFLGVYAIAMNYIMRNITFYMGFRNL